MSTGAPRAQPPDMLPPYPSTPPQSPSRSSHKRSDGPERAAHHMSAELHAAIRVRYSHAKDISGDWSLTYSLPSLEYDSLAPPLVLLPPAELSATPPTPTAAPRATSTSMKRSPGMRNLNLFTRFSFGGLPKTNRRVKASADGLTPTPTSALVGDSDDGGSSPELPESPDSGYGKDYSMSDDDDPYLAAESPCAAKSERSGSTKRRSLPLPTTKDEELRRLRWSPKGRRDAQMHQPVEGSFASLGGGGHLLVDGLGLSI